MKSVEIIAPNVAPYPSNQGEFCAPSVPAVSVDKNLMHDRLFWAYVDPAAVLSGVNTTDPILAPRSQRLVQEAIDRHGGVTQALNKTPSAIGSDGRVHRMKEWNDRITDASEAVRIANELRYNVLLRLVNLRVVDIDVIDPATAAKIEAMAFDHLGAKLPIRRRTGTCKASIFVRVQGNRYMKKVVLILPDYTDQITGGTVKTGAVEFLGQSQQSVVEGTHENGSSYYWEALDRSNGAAAFPVVTEAQMIALFTAVAALPGVD